MLVVVVVGCGVGGLVWVWFGCGVGVVWVWSGCGLRVVWVWFGYGLGVVWCGLAKKHQSRTQSDK